MAPEYSQSAKRAGAGPNYVRPGHGEVGAGEAGGLDAVDQVIVRELARDARLPNNELAARARIAPSTCLGRVRALRERGVIRGYHADIDPASVGRPLQAMVAIRLQASARGHIRAFTDHATRLPGVLNVYFLGGKDDFLLHVAAGSSHALRDLIEHLSADTDVAYTETSLIFEHFRADPLFPGLAAPAGSWARAARAP